MVFFRIQGDKENGNWIKTKNKFGFKQKRAMRRYNKKNFDLGRAVEESIVLNAVDVTVLSTYL